MVFKAARLAARWAPPSQVDFMGLWWGGLGELVVCLLGSNEGRGWMDLLGCPCYPYDTFGGGELADFCLAVRFVSSS